MPGRKIILILDGAADRPVPELGGRTPLDAAATPHLDELAKKGEVGFAATVPEEFTAASDVANLSLLGYEPKGIYTGRGPLEAAAMGVALEDGEIAFRVNTISLTDDGRLKDYSAGHITTEESRRVIDSARPLFEKFAARIHPGVQYRHLMVRRDALETKTYPPHDNVGRPIVEIKPGGVLGEIFEASRELLKDHPVNIERRKRGLNAVDALWPWGQGKAVKLATIGERYGVNGCLVSAVDLIRGIGVLAGYRILRVPGITGYYDTNYAGKADAVIAELREGTDIGVIHVESPDEAGHSKDVPEKVRAIENIDREIVGRLVREIPELAIFALPDHPTHVGTGLHGSEPVPYLIADIARPNKRLPGPSGYAEKHAGGAPIRATELFDRFMRL